APSRGAISSGSKRIRPADARQASPVRVRDGNVLVSADRAELLGAHGIFVSEPRRASLFSDDLFGSHPAQGVSGAGVADASGDGGLRGYGGCWEDRGGCEPFQSKRVGRSGGWEEGLRGDALPFGRGPGSGSRSGRPRGCGGSDGSDEHGGTGFSCDGSACGSECGQGGSRRRGDTAHGTSLEGMPVSSGGGGERGAQACESERPGRSNDADRLSEARIDGSRAGGCFGLGPAGGGWFDERVVGHGASGSPGGGGPRARSCGCDTGCGDVPKIVGT